jgi:D-aspartate ligase
MNPLQRRALVLAVGTNGLGIIRGLSAHGVESVVACKTRLDPSYLSRIPESKYLLADAARLEDELLALIGRVQHRVDCVIPSSDEYASLLRRLSHKIPATVKFILPPGDLVDQLNDKRSEIQLIKGVGVPLPRTEIDLASLEVDEARLRFPVIVKPRTYKGFASLGAKNRIVEDAQSLIVFLDKHRAILDELLLQEVIPGDESHQWVCNATFDHASDMVSAFSFQRLGTIPYLYGVTTLAVSRHNADVKSLCQALGRALQYTGPLMAEFKQDPRSGAYCYIEINPRLGMCNWFDDRCGVANAFNTYALAVGAPLEHNLDHQVDGKVYWNLVLDLYARRQGGQPLLQVLSLYRKTLTTRLVFPALSITDPLPAASHTLATLWRRLSTRRKPPQA